MWIEQMPQDCETELLLILIWNFEYYNSIYLKLKKTITKVSLSSPSVCERNLNRTVTFSVKLENNRIIVRNTCVVLVHTWERNFAGHRTIPVFCIELLSEAKITRAIGWRLAHNEGRGSPAEGSFVHHLCQSQREDHCFSPLFNKYNPVAIQLRHTTIIRNNISISSAGATNTLECSHVPLLQTMQQYILSKFTKEIIITTVIPGLKG
jgi:hypothetical protein